jgi:serine phosphatase RsbU (regulator of sigma subunit)
MTIDTQSPLSILAHLRHELRTPINAIIGYSEMLLEEVEETNQASECLGEELERIRECGVQLLASINTFLNPPSLPHEQLSLQEIVANPELQAKLQEPTQVVINYCQKLIPTVETDFVADLEKINQAANRLLAEIDNMVNFHSVDLSLQQLEKNAIAERGRSSIAEGVAEPITKHSPKVITQDGQDSIACELALQSQINLDQLDMVNNPDSLEIEKIASNSSNSAASTILVVDDNETNRDLLSRQIKAQGYQAVTAVDGKQAIQMIQTGEYDLILLDIIMPELDGYEVLKWIRNSDWRYIPTIMISALDEMDSVIRCIEMGAEDYLAKPFNSVFLKARIGACLEQKRLRDQESLYVAQLAEANNKIISLNSRLEAENIRLSAELEITKRLQMMLLPKEKELSQIESLEIAGFMEPADEFGGDYYDVLQHHGRITIGIGDVTGHGLESGVLMLMVQTAVRTLMENNETEPKKFFEVLNRTIYKNVQRMDSDKNLSLCLVNYHEGILSLSGQHEELVVVRSNGAVERIDTVDLGFPIGLEETIEDFVFQAQVQLNTGDVAVLYTDGVTEAENNLGVQYGLENLCAIVRQSYQQSAQDIRQSVIANLRSHIGVQKVYDDITLVVLKQK